MSSAVSGSGSLEQDGPLGIVAMKKEEQTGIVHDLGFGKGQCHTDKTSQALSSCVIPALHMGRFSGLFAHSSVLLFRDHSSIDFQKIREAVSLPIPLRNRFPQPLTRLFAPITHGIGDHLSRLAAQGDPHPDLLGFFEHKRPQSIGFQRGGSGIFWIGGHQGRAQGGKLSYFFLIHLDTVVRETPNVRVRPRKLLRS